MAMMQPVLVVGHGPVAEAIAFAVAGAGWPVTHVAPIPDGLAFTLPITCPVPALAELPVRKDLPLVAPFNAMSTPEELTFDGSTYQLKLADGSSHRAGHLILASTRWAAKLLPQLGLSLPLRPARAHQLNFHAFTLSRPVAEHLGYGTIAAWSNMLETALVYDGLADPTQATFSGKPDERIVKAITGWLRQKLPAGSPALPDPIVTPWSLATTPDYLPIIGPWPGYQGLSLALGVAGWGASLALPLANLFVTTFNGQPWPAHLAFIGPHRFAAGQAQPVARPRWLVERHSTSVQPQFATNVRLTGGATLEIMSDVQLVGEADASFAQNVRTTEKSITRAGGLGKNIGSGKEKPKIQAAGTRLK